MAAFADIASSFFRKPDFNNDGAADYLWRNDQSGDVAFWLGAGASTGARSTLAFPVGREWSMETADFDGNGTSDVFLRNSSTGENRVWLMNGTTVTSFVTLVTVPVGGAAGWNYAFGDFNGDRRTDLLWRNNTTGDTALWLEVASGGSGPVFNVPVTWTVDVADFNGDGRTDLFWRNVNQPTTAATYGQNAIWIMNGRTVVTSPIISQTPAGFDYDFGDFNGDGRTDFYWRNTSTDANLTGRNYIWIMNGTVKVDDREITRLSNSWDYDLADFNGDNRTDFVWRNVTNGADSIYGLPSGFTSLWLMNGATVAETSGGAAEVVPLTWIYEFGDFNGDNRTDFLWRQSVPNGTTANGDGLTQIWLVNGVTLTKGNLPQLSTYRSTTDGDWNFVIRDFNGDGRSDIFWRNTDVNDQSDRAKQGVYVMNGTTITNLTNTTTAGAIAYFTSNPIPGGQAIVPVGDPNSTPVRYRWYLEDPELGNLGESDIRPGDDN
jgi:FG-GAP-like repeat